jgi:flagellar motor switch protein FliM
MERVLNQEEIDAMVRAARSGKSELPSAPRPRPKESVQVCDFRQAGQLSKEQVRVISSLHEGFARNLSHSMAAYLRVVFEVNLVSVEQLAYREFLAQMAEVTYMTALHVREMNSQAALQIDHALVFPIVDILLGGVGSSGSLGREVTEIEEQIMDGVARMICRELQGTWHPIGFSVELEGRQPSGQMQRFFAPTEKTMLISFEVNIGEVRSTMNLLFPASVSNAILRKLAGDTGYAKPRKSAQSGARIFDRMKDSIFSTELGLKKIKLSIDELLAVQPGSIIDLGVAAYHPAAFCIAGKEVFQAHAVRNGRKRAAQLANRLQTHEEGKRAL